MCGKISSGKKTLDREYDTYSYEIPKNCSNCGEELDERCEVD